VKLEKNVFYVWSKGLEEWEPVSWAGFDDDWPVWLHQKRYGEGFITVFIDSLGRYFCSYQERRYAQED
jgi:hypothetical protein